VTSNARVMLSIGVTWWN